MQKPERFEYAQIVRFLASLDGRLPEVATRLYGEWSDHEVMDLHRSRDQTRVTVNLPCLTGPEGVLPHYFQDALRQSSIERQDDSFFAFLELFNSILLLKRYRVDQYSSLTATTEAEQLGDIDFSAFYPGVDGLFAVPWQRRQSLLRLHPQLKVETTNTSGIHRILSDYFSLDIRVAKQPLCRQVLPQDCLWKLGQQASFLGQSAILGFSVMQKDTVTAIHIRVTTKQQWQLLQQDNSRVSALYHLASLLIRSGPVRCYADVPGYLLDDPVLGSAMSDSPTLGQKNCRLGQYQVFRPQQCGSLMVSIQLLCDEQSPDFCFSQQRPYLQS